LAESMTTRERVVGRATCKRETTLRLLENGNFSFQTAPPDPNFKSGYSRPETLAAQKQLAWILGGDCRSVNRIDTGVPRRFRPSQTHCRIPDVVFKGGYSELKFAGDRVNREGARIDGFLRDQGYAVRYDVVPHPFTNQVTPAGDLAWLRDNGISYMRWDFRFWRLGKARGLEVPLTWALAGD